jgi:hypothetical protein
MVHGAATGLERRFEHLIGDYFGPGGVETRPGEDGLRHRRGHRHAAREGMTRVLRLCGVTVLVWALLAAAAGSVVASPYPLGESSVTPAPGSELDVPPKGLPVSFTTPGPAQLLFATVEISSQNALDPDGTLADDRRIGFGLLFARGSSGLTFSGNSIWSKSVPGMYYFQFSGLKVTGLSGRNARCPAGEPTCLYTSQVYSVMIPEPPPASTGWISGRNFAYLSANQARTIVRRAIRREAGRKPRNLRYRCHRRTDATFACKASWSDRKYAWAVRVTVKARASHYVYSARGSRASLSCLKRTSLRRCAVDVHWPTRPLARASASAVGSAPSSGRPQRPVGKRRW